MSEQTYGHICDNCETPAYPLYLYQVRTTQGEIKDYFVCDDCTPAYEQETGYGAMSTYEERQDPSPFRSTKFRARIRF
jgi:hypothetical protein